MFLVELKEYVRQTIKSAILSVVDIGRMLKREFTSGREIILTSYAKLREFNRKLGWCAVRIVTGVKRFNELVSPEKIVLPGKFIFFVSMFLFSFLIIALETIQFHVLLIVTNYLKATFIISIAMLGIAIGSLIGFYLSRFNIRLILFFSSVFLFFSIVLAYYNIINIGSLKYPYFLILPFIFATINISSIFTHGNSNTMYFINLFASALGVLFPIFFLPVFKSESSMMILMLVPLVYICIQSFGIANIPAKLIIAILSLVCIVAFIDMIKNNINTPDIVTGDIFEKKIMAELDPDPDAESFTKNVPLEFFSRVYELNRETDRYKFCGDTYDSNRVRYFLQLLGCMKRWGIGKMPFLENEKTIIENYESIERTVFEYEIIPLLKIKHNTYFRRNYDLLFLNRVYKKDDNGNYLMVGDDYDKKRASYLFTQLGHRQTIDLNFDVRYHESLRYDRKIYAGSDRILLSEDSILGRLEYTGHMTGGMEGKDFWKDIFCMFVNGVVLDTAGSGKGTYRDPRVPWMPIENPKMFILGLSADGIAKSNNRIKGAEVSGIEIIPAVVRTMSENGPFAYIAEFPYENTKVYEGEGRSFLENANTLFDAIYLMNIHMEHGPVSTLSPEYIHTVEGIEVLLKNITGQGYVVFEEIIDNPRSEAALYKMMNTIKAAMRNIGIETPSKHFFIFKWDFSKHGDDFRTIIIKRTPFNDADKNVLDKYLVALQTIEPFIAYNVDMVYDPYGKRFDNEVEKYVLNDLDYNEYLPAHLRSDVFTQKIIHKLADPGLIRSIYRMYSFNKRTGMFETNPDRLNEEDTIKLKKALDIAGFPYEYDLTPATDNKPFPFNVYIKKTEVMEILNIVFVLSLFIVVPVLLLMLNKAGQYKMNLTLPNLFVAFTGFGYMLVEIVLMQVFQRFIGRPTISLIVTLGGLLLFSGLGSFISRYIQHKVLILLTALIPIILFIMSKSLNSIFLFFIDHTFDQKIWISVLLLFPVTFLMGIPFPNAVEKVKKFTSDEYGTLMFGISGGFSTIGATSAILINVTHGYSTSFAAGILCYLAGFIFFTLIMLKSDKAIV